MMPSTHNPQQSKARFFFFKPTFFFPASVFQISLLEKKNPSNQKKNQIKSNHLLIDPAQKNVCRNGNWQRQRYGHARGTFVS